MMPWEVAKAGIDHVMDEGKSNQLKSMTLGFNGGGEPTLNWSILTKAVDYTRILANKNKVDLHISGAFNGYWPPKVRKYMVKNFTDISMSFDGAPFVQNLQRPAKGKTKSFAKVAETLNALDKENLSYGIRMTVTDDSVSSLAHSISFICENFKPCKIQVEPVFIEGRAKKIGAVITDLDLFVDQFIKGYKVAEQAEIEMFYSDKVVDDLSSIKRDDFHGNSVQAIEKSGFYDAICAEKSIPKEAITLAISMDATSVLLKKEGWRHAVAATISTYNMDGDRLNTIYIGRMPC